MPRCPLRRQNLLSARSRPATHQRSRMSPSRQRVTREVTRRVTEGYDNDSRQNGPFGNATKIVINPSLATSCGGRLGVRSGIV